MELEQWGKLREAAQILMGFAEKMGALRPDSTATVGELLDQFLTAKTATGRSARYLRQMKTSVNCVLGERRGRRIAEVTTEEIRLALASLEVAPRTVKTYFTDVRTLFNFAVRRELIARNPVAPIDPPHCPAKPPALHSPGEVRRVLEEARVFNPVFCRALAIRYFAGLRSAEVFRLSEAEIGAGYIEVTAAKAKTRRRRLVAITANLRAWLDLGAALPVGRTSGLAARVAERAECPWPQNVTRHSFCSYHLAHFGSAGRTALEAGHTEAMLFNHYRELVTREAAAEFFQIVPQ